jgi:hypothetical protein
LATTSALTDNFCKIGMAQKVLVASAPATGDPSSVRATVPGISANGENPRRQKANNQNRFMTN